MTGGDEMEISIRLKAFEWLDEQELIHGELLPRRILEQGFMFAGQRITLSGPSGIWIPKVFDKMPISITTSPNRPYADGISADDQNHYKYRRQDVHHRDNAGLREAMATRTPLIYFHGIEPGYYLAFWPVFITGDDPAGLTFTASVGEKQSIGEARQPDAPLVFLDGDHDARRAYATSAVRVRLHQHSFRRRVLRAYQSQCAFCRLKHEELLDAAHIVPDNAMLGEPLVINGMSLCKIHHAAFDINIIGVTPDFIIKVREDILEEIDGPMLKHGIQAMQNTKIALPGKRHDWPDQERLDQRYKQFLSAG